MIDNNIMIPPKQTDDYMGYMQGIGTTPCPAVPDIYGYNIPYTEPANKAGGSDRYIEDELPDKISLISKEGWERSFSFCKERIKKNGLYRSSYLIFDPGHPYIQPISHTVRAILGDGYIPSMPKSTMVLSYLSGVFFKRAEKMLDNRSLEVLANADHNKIKEHLKETEGSDRITFNINKYCRVTERKNPTGNTYKCILKRLAECMTLMGAILKDPKDPDSAEYFPVIEDLGFKDKMITFKSRYMAMLVAKVIQSDISKDKNGNITRASHKNGGKPLLSYQMGAALLKERNGYALDIAGNICVLLDQAGKHPGVYPHITYDNLIKRSGTLQMKMNDNKDSSLIYRAFFEAWKILPKTNLGSKYPGIKLPIPNEFMTRDIFDKKTLEIPHACTGCSQKKCMREDCPQKATS